MNMWIWINHEYEFYTGNQLNDILLYRDGGVGYDSVHQGVRAHVRTNCLNLSWVEGELYIGAGHS